MGLVSCVIEFNNICIVGIETHCVKSHDGINTLLTAHIEKLRSHRELSDAWFIFIPEGKYCIFCSRVLYSSLTQLLLANLGHEASHMQVRITTNESFVQNNKLTTLH